jgi:predicted nucleic-acid-binding protein
MRAVDTDVLVRLLVRDDASQVARAEEFSRPGAWVSHVVLVEALWVLRSVYEVDARRIAAAVDLLLDHRELALQDTDVVRAALAHFKKRPSLGFSDCLIVEIARKAGHDPLGTFDRDLAKVHGVERL